MTARRVASACKAPPTIAAALKTSPEFVERTAKLAKLINRLHPAETVEDQQTTETVLWIAMGTGLDEMEAHYRREAGHA